MHTCPPLSPLLYFSFGSSCGEESDLCIYWFTCLCVSTVRGRRISLRGSRLAAVSPHLAGGVGSNRWASPLWETQKCVACSDKWRVCINERRKNGESLLPFACCFFVPFLYLNEFNYLCPSVLYIWILGPSLPPGDEGLRDAGREVKGQNTECLRGVRKASRICNLKEHDWLWEKRKQTNMVTWFDQICV